MTHRLLFLCTGNYYRSRYAAHYFNHLAQQYGLDWVADSRGLATELGVYNAGPMAPVAITHLGFHGIRVDNQLRFPLQVTPADLASASMVIALDEYEHRPYLATRYPGWENRVVYWHVHDLGLTPASTALAAIDKHVQSLVRQLQARHREELRGTFRPAGTSQ